MAKMAAMPEPDVLVKSWTDGAELKMSADANEFSGMAAGIGNMDRSGDVLLPGCFKDAIPEMLESGAVLAGHRWGDWPVAMFKSGEERPNGLAIVGTFHSDPESQRARTIVRERLDMGKKVGLSVGIRVDYSSAAIFENGKALVKWADDAGHKLRERGNILKWDRYCRAIPKVLAVWEVSFVNIPANPQAGVAVAKEFADMGTSGMVEQARALIDQITKSADANEFSEQIDHMAAALASLKTAPLPAERVRALINARYAFVRGQVAG